MGQIARTGAATFAGIVLGTSFRVGTPRKYGR
ncbi:MAG: hypothetical protein ACJA1L_003688, partial [Paracoccaceae bacterium]